MKTILISILFVAVAQAQNTITLPGAKFMVTEVDARTPRYCKNGRGATMSDEMIARTKGLKNHVDATTRYFADVTNWKGQEVVIATVAGREVLLIKAKSQESREILIYNKSPDDETYVGPYEDGSPSLMSQFNKSARGLVYEETLLFNDIVCKWTAAVDLR